MIYSEKHLAALLAWKPSPRLLAAYDRSNAIWVRRG